MAITFEATRQLLVKQSLPLVSLKQRTTGVTYYKLDMAGNSLLSTVYVNAISAGGSVEVDYFDFTTGFDEGELNELKSHLALNTAPSYNKILVSNCHDKIVMRLTVVGAVEFSVYGTVVNSTVSDLDAALVQEAQAVNFILDKAVPVAGLDTDSNVWRFLRMDKDGSLFVKSVTNFTARKYASKTIAKGVLDTVISYSPTAETKIVKVLVGGNGLGEFEVKVNGVSWAKGRSHWANPQIYFDLGALELAIGDTMTVDALNFNLSNNNATYEAWIYEG